MLGRTAVLCCGRPEPRGGSGAALRIAETQSFVDEVTLVEVGSTAAAPRVGAKRDVHGARSHRAESGHPSTVHVDLPKPCSSREDGEDPSPSCSMLFKPSILCPVNASSPVPGGQRGGCTPLLGLSSPRFVLSQELRSTKPFW